MGWIILEWLIGAHHWLLSRVISRGAKCWRIPEKTNMLFLMRIMIWEPFMTGNFDAQLKAIRAITNNISRLLVEQTSQTSGETEFSSKVFIKTKDLKSWNFRHLHLPCPPGILVAPAVFDAGRPLPIHYIWAVQPKKWLLKRYPHMKARQDKIRSRR